MARYDPNPGKFLREWFPEQTKSPGAIIIWTIVFLLDVALVFVIANAIGFNILDLRVTSQIRSLIVMVFLLIAFVLFWLEAFVYNRIRGVQ